MTEPRKRFVTWSELTARCTMLAKAIAGKGDEEVHLVALARGGWIPARMIQGALQALGITCSISSIRMESYEGTKKGAVKVYGNLSLGSGCVNYFVDDLVDTGDTMKHAFALANREAAGMQVFSCVIFFKPKSSHSPTIFAEVVDDDEWIVFPYELEELN